MSRVARTSFPSALLVAHLAALGFGLVGLLLILPNPELWAGGPPAVQVFDFAMTYAGSVHIILGAMTMLAAGVLALGWRKTASFAVVACGLSLGSELIGTGSGWPFGNYAYTDFLGYKILDRVPYTIPLSWFYMGLASYLLGSRLAARLAVRRRTAWSLALGAWFLTVWDLVLDPAMAHDSLRVQFWVWEEAGPYFGMPIKNFAGWTMTGLLFMAISRALWRRDVEPTALPMRFPLAIYVANMLFAIVLSVVVGLWLPILLAAVLGVLPAVLAVYPGPLPAIWTLRWAADG
jgi:putative membrane protein